MARKDITVPMDEQLKNRVEAQLVYGDSRSEWIREAIRQRLDKETESGNETPAGVCAD